ncbi:MAG: hypothetical protein RDV41_00985, partial [Planctomycetota bacterium]|nr:hypothetical protein [Planctomycetota bacterium]
ENANLSDDAKEAVRTFKMLCDAEAHKSKLSLARDISDGVKESRFYPFPRFTKSQAGATHNVLFLATRCWLSTLSYLKPLLAHAGDAWLKRYRRTLDALDQTILKGPGTMMKGFAEVVSKVFVGA